MTCIVETRRRAAFFAKNETFSYNKMQQVTHIDNKVERLQVMQARAGSWPPPEGGSVIHYKITLQVEKTATKKDVVSCCCG